MNISETGINMIKTFEGFALTAYQNAGGIWTIGYGHASGVRKGDQITENTATQFLLADLVPVEKTLSAAVSTTLSQDQYDALCCFIFSVGSPAFSGSTLLKQINQGEFTAAADDFTNWNKVAGNPVAGLTRRRLAERQLFLSEYVVSD